MVHSMHTLQYACRANGFINAMRAPHVGIINVDGDLENFLIMPIIRYFQYMTRIQAWSQQGLA